MSPSADGAIGDSAEQLHRALALYNRHRLRPAQPDSTDWRAELRVDARWREQEIDWVEQERAALTPQLAKLPGDSQAFMEWFEDLRDSGPGQNDPLFPWLAQRANREQMRWFLTQEAAGEAGFDDLVALTQVRLPVRAKLELARNYWDEMGRGHQKGMHGLMLEGVVHELQLEPSPETTVWESLALANLMVALAANRRYAWHAVGALGVIEMTAPGRVSLVNEGLRRLRVSARGRRYFQLHAGLDIRHSEDWNREVIAPLVADDPALAQPIAEGALLRLRAGARCFARYRRELGLAHLTASARPFQPSRPQSLSLA